MDVVVVRRQGRDAAHALLGFGQVSRRTKFTGIPGRYQEFPWLMYRLRVHVMGHCGMIGHDSTRERARTCTVPTQHTPVRTRGYHSVR